MTKLRQWRTERGWSLNEFSGLTGYSVAYLSRVEREERVPGPEVKITIARRLGADVRELFDLPPVDSPRVAA